MKIPFLCPVVNVYAYAFPIPCAPKGGFTNQKAECITKFSATIQRGVSYSGM
jgi:hypothetical protein